MAKFCMNCGSRMEDQAAFCTHCGSPAVNVPQSQPQPQQMQPQSQSQQWIEPQPVYQQPEPQPAAPEPTAKVKANGMCTAGFVLSLLGLFLFGITSLFGLLFSVFGLISAGKKKQGGKGKAVAGIILSAVMIAAILFTFVFLKDPLLDKYEQLTGRAFPTRQVTPEFDNTITENGWVIAEEESCIQFNKKDRTFNTYLSYLETSDVYLTGHYEIADGKKAVDYLMKKAGDSCLTEDEIENILEYSEYYEEDNLVVLRCDYEAFVYQGETQDDFETVTRYYYGFFVPIIEGEQIFAAVEMYNLESGEPFTLILEDQYDDYRFAAEFDSGESAEP